MGRGIIRKDLATLGRTIWTTAKSYEGAATGVLALAAFLNQPLGEYFIDQFHGLPWWSGFAVIIAWSLIILARRVREMEEKLAPRAAIEFEENGYYERTMDGRDDELSRGRTFRVGMHNVGGEPLENCVVQIDDLFDRAQNIRPLKVPIALQREEGAGPFPLRPGQVKFALVATLDETQPASNIFIHAEGGKARDHLPHDQEVERSDYEVTISVYPEKGRPAKRRFRLFIDEAGFLALQPLKRSGS